MLLNNSLSSKATRDARIEEGEGGAVTLENKGSKGCSTLNGDKGKSTINRSTIKSHNSGDSGTGKGRDSNILNSEIFFREYI